MSVSFSDALSRAWQHTKTMLFQPFDPGKWMILGFSAWLARLLSWGSSGGGGTDFKTDGGDWHSGDLNAFFNETWAWMLEHLWLVGLLSMLVIALVVLVAVLTWISSRGKFIFLDNVLRDQAEVVEPWKRFRRLGNSLFGFRLVMGLTQLLACLGIVTWGLGWAYASPDGWSSILYPLIGLAVFLFLLSAAMGLISFFLDAFVVPIMHRRDITVWQAWSVFGGLLASHPGVFVLCTLLLAVLAIAVFVVLFMVGLLTCCVGWLLLAIPYIGTVLILPILVTYRYFTADILAQLDPELAVP